MLNILEKNELKCLETVSWFSSVGANKLFSQSKAIDMIESMEWENFQLDRSGDTTEYLSLHYKESYREWNSITEELKHYLEINVYPNIEEALHKYQLSERILPSIHWDILSYLQEKVYEHLGIPTFYNLTLDSYKKGMIPCGWLGSYPCGKLLEY